jgi:predicted ABC-type ATPase
LLRAKAEGYRVRLIFFSLRNSDLAISRVKSRVLEGGHNIESDVIKRRFVRGLSNFFYIYSKIIEDWNLFDNSQNPITHIAESEKDKITIYNVEFWNYLKSGNYE